MNDLFNARGYIRSAFRLFAGLICILLLLELIAHASFGPLLAVGIIVYAAYRIWSAAGPKRPQHRPRNTGGAERIPLEPGGHHQ
jgi:hypothetical protein